MENPRVAFSLTHEEAINRTLREYRLEGIETIISLHTRLLEEDALHCSEYHTDYLDELLKEEVEGSEKTRGSTISLGYTFR